MSTIIDRYSSHQRVLGYSRRTIGERRWSLGRWETHLATHGADWATATVDHLENFLAHWPAAQSRYSIRSDIHQCYRWAINRSVLDCADPTDALPPPKLAKLAPTPIPTEDVRRLIAAASGRDRLIVMLAAYAGLRISEIAVLDAGDVDLRARVLVVRGGKGGVSAVVPIADELAAELARWPRRGRYLTIGGATVGARIRKLLRAHGITGRPHDLRHSYGTSLARRTNGNVVLVKALMRHSQVNTTMRYIGWDPSGHEFVTGLYDEEPEAA